MSGARLKPVGDVKAFSNRDDHRNEAWYTADGLNVGGDVVRVGQCVVGQQQEVAFKLRQQQRQLLGRAHAIRIEKHRIEGPTEFRDNLRRVPDSNVGPSVQTGAGKIQAGLGSSFGIPLNGDERFGAWNSAQRIRNPQGAIAVGGANFKDTPPAPGQNQQLKEPGSGTLKVEPFVPMFRLRGVVSDAFLLELLEESFKIGSRVRR